MIILGMVALGATVAATLASVLVLAWILIIAGAGHLVEAFQVRQWKGVAWHLLLGVVDVLVGVWLLVNPAVGAVKITLILAIFLVIEGILQVIAALAGRPPNRGWQIFSGVITFVLGVMVWREWPYSATWWIGWIGSTSRISWRSKATCRSSNCGILNNSRKNCTTECAAFRITTLIDSVSLAQTDSRPRHTTAGEA